MPCVVPMRVLPLVVWSVLLAGCGETAHEGAVPDALQVEAGQPPPASPPEAGADKLRGEVPVACRGAVIGGACDDSFLLTEVPGTYEPYRFVCEATAAHDPMCRPRLTCTGKTWQLDEVYATGPESAACDVFPLCAGLEGGGFCEGSDGKLCLSLNDGPHCDQSEVFHGPMVLAVPQAGSACTEEGKQVYDCGMGGGDRRCVAGVWVVAVGYCW